ncbi:dihydrofolate reductase [Arthroderma uncinatum]|uniref:dihydrofolate reductase n=1 Tax=Arthroderma uncinatum TaxID=74035 RepID=UPI00144AE4E2|nr:dihydrofolate reductase [Arthroderma uncinatum]KAF3480479.1 dihydrofolate reductase [Arthroderma uncinatum]
MATQQPTSRALHASPEIYDTARINADITQLLQRFENIMAAATVDNPSRTSSAIESYQLDVESTALIRAAEDILSLTRTLKETWLFGKLDTLGEDERDIQRQAPPYNLEMTNEPENANMPAKLPPLTLVVATTPITTAANPGVRKLGIGKGGTLPWPKIKTDMSFFARVTTRPPPVAASSATPTPAINAVIMGRKTYDSIPARFRPLSKRLNVIITRDESGSVKERAIADWNASKQRELEKEAKENNQESSKSTSIGEPEIIVSNSLEAALSTLQKDFGSSSSSGVEAGKKPLGNIYIMGGSEIYMSSLRLTPSVLGENNPLRIVMTDVRRRGESDSKSDVENLVDGFECDTSFPVDQKGMEEGWKKISSKELGEWVGEEVSPDWTWEGDVAVKMSGYERL